MKSYAVTKFLSVLYVAWFACGCGKRPPSKENQAQGSVNSNRLSLRQSSDSFGKKLSLDFAPQNISTQLFGHMAERPSANLLLSVRSGDKARLTGYYVTHVNPLDRHAATWALGLIGDEETIDLFARALTNDFSGRTLSGRRSNTAETEENALESTIYALGFLGAKYDSAFEFLVNAAEVNFWARHKSWQSDTGPDEIGILVTKSIVALGMTGREDVPQLLTGMKNKALKNDFDPQPHARTFEDGVVEGAFYHSVFRERGAEGFRIWYLNRTGDPFDGDGSLRKWKMSDEGRGWFEWYEQR